MYFGIPRSGKTWLATRRAIHAMLRGKKKVFTNYPVYVPGHGTTYKWSRELVHDVIKDSLIVIDEAYRDYDFRNKTGFTPEEDFFFGTSGQNGVDIIVIAHSPIRVDPKIRDRAEVFHRISKQTLPFISFIWWYFTDREIILWFRDECYLTEQEVSTGEPFDVDHILYDKKVSAAYDTHQFRTKADMREDFEKWEAPQRDERGIIRRIIDAIKGIRRRSKT